MQEVLGWARQLLIFMWTEPCEEIPILLPNWLSFLYCRYTKLAELKNDKVLKIDSDQIEDGNIADDMVLFDLWYQVYWDYFILTSSIFSLKFY